jgi:mevalonate kinase
MNKFYAKILLFGEYSVLTGSSAFTIPYHKYSGQLVESHNLNIEEQHRSNQNLYKFHEYLQKEKRFNDLVLLNLGRFEGDLKNGLYFNSSIPIHYGLGSSGALVAAVFKKYDDSKLDSFSLERLKNMFVLAESFYHGQSSGIDPLTSYISKPLIFSKNEIELVEKKMYTNTQGQFYLYDSETAANTQNFVSIFNKKLTSKAFTNQFNKDYVQLVDATIFKIAKQRKADISKEMQSISKLQLKFFREMIPDNIVPFWENGVQSGNYSVKLCGSGGGGFFLVYSQLPAEELDLYFDKPLESI